MNIRTILAGAACVAILGACTQQETDQAANETGSAVNAAQDATSTAVGQTSAAVLGANTVGGFVNALTISNMYELESARIATSKSRNDAVRDLAATLTIDHSAATARLKALAPTAAPGVALPTQMDERRQGLIDNLNAATPADFDRVWLQQQVAAHDETLTVLNGFADNSDAPALAQFGQGMVEKITMHRDKAKALLDAM